MDKKQRSYDSTHYYAAHARATKVEPGHVFWNNQAEGWSFNVIIDGVTVRSNNRYPRHHIATEALRLEVDSIRAMLTAAAESAAQLAGVGVANDDDPRRFAVGVTDDAE